MYSKQSKKFIWVVRNITKRKDIATVESETWYEIALLNSKNAAGLSKEDSNGSSKTLPLLCKVPVLLSGSSVTFDAVDLPSVTDISTYSDSDIHAELLGYHVCYVLKHSTISERGENIITSRTIC